LLSHEEESNIIIKRAESRQDAYDIAELAEKIWTEHYTPIIGIDQVKYMLDKFQSFDRIYSDISSGEYLYFIALCSGIPAGYSSIKTGSNKDIFLSKLYVEKAHRGMGIAKKIINTVKDIGIKGGYQYIWLTVNKNNSGSIEAYKRMGFIIIDKIVTDIGGGFVMDDYKMRLELM